MRVVTQAELVPPYKCFVCGSTDDPAWLDTGHDFWPQGVTDRDGRIYLCGTCIEISATECGFERGDRVERAGKQVAAMAVLLKQLHAEQMTQWETVLELDPLKATPSVGSKLPEVIKDARTESTRASSDSPKDESESNGADSKTKRNSRIKSNLNK